MLLACCSAGDQGASEADRGTLIARVIDWPRVIRLAEHHGVIPLAYQALRNATDSVPPTILDELRNRYQHIARKNLQFTAELFRVLDCLEAQAITAIPLKGPMLAETVYGELALRDFSDLDVPVQPQNVLKAKAALGALGYTVNTRLSELEERAHLATGYEYTFDGPAGRNLLEIQWNILPRFYAVDFGWHEFFELNAHRHGVWPRGAHTVARRPAADSLRTRRKARLGAALLAARHRGYRAVANDRLGGVRAARPGPGYRAHGGRQLAARASLAARGRAGVDATILAYGYRG